MPLKICEYDLLVILCIEIPPGLIISFSNLRMNVSDCPGGRIGVRILDWFFRTEIAGKSTGI